MTGSRTTRVQGSNAVRDAYRALGDPRARPNVAWVRALTGATRETVESTLAELSDLLPVERVIRERHLAGGRPTYAQIRAPFDLYALVRILRPDHVVETGVSSGVSSAHFLLALRRNRHGALHSVDRPIEQRGEHFGSDESPVAVPRGASSGWAIPPKLRTGWDLRLGPSEEILPPLVDELPSVGLFLHDSRHTPAHLRFELETVRPKLAPGAVVLADNTVWTGAAFPRFARALGVPVRRRGRTDLVGLRYPPGTAASPRAGVRSPGRYNGRRSS